ncbi:mucin-17-like [Pollicipes pollicipes]|uniref:mucin-17-like n=1 Tax=Pollicipes pollicipes TaxID=41117 RepID=UPI0018856188|nr:mucin-17-like [Pollicipes pollicipes]
MCPTTPEEATSPCSSSRSSVEDLGAAAKWRDKADLYTSYDQTLKEMQRELETVEADYALDRRRKSSDDVISTPSSYRSRSSSIPSSEDVDEPRLFQMVEQPEHLIEEEEDDIADSQSERSDWSASALRMRRQHASPSVSSACEERPFTAGATRTFEIPTVDTRSLSGLPPASNAPVLVAAQRTVYSVDEGLVKVTVREQAETPPPSPVADVTGTAEESVSLRPAPSEESDRLSSTTPTPTASPLLLRQTEVTGSRSPMRPSLSVTSQDSTPSAEGSEADSATPCEGASLLSAAAFPAAFGADAGRPSDQSKRSVLSQAGSSQSIRGMIDKFNNISDTPETSTPVTSRKELVTSRPRLEPPNLALQLQKSLSDGVVASASCADDNGDEGGDVSAAVQARSASGSAVPQLEPSVGDLAKSSSLPAAGRGADGLGLAALPPRWSPLPPIASQVPRLTSSPVSARTRILPDQQSPPSPMTPSSSGVTSPLSLTSSLVATSSGALDSSLDSSFDSAFEHSRARESRGSVASARAERLRRARDEFFGATWSALPAGAEGGERVDGAFPFGAGAESPLRPPRRRENARSAGLAHSKSTGTINEVVRLSDVSCGSDFSDIRVEDARPEVPQELSLDADAGEGGAEAKVGLEAAETVPVADARRKAVLGLEPQRELRAYQLED